MAASSNGTGADKPTHPKTAETARTVVDITQEGTLSTLAADGTPIGSPVCFSLDKQGQPVVQLGAGSTEHAHLGRDARCSLAIRPSAFPAKALASVTLVGKIDVSQEVGGGHQLAVEKCMYFGGLDEQTVELSGDEYRSAEPDVLRSSAPELVNTWNEERAEDIYRITSCHLGVPLTDMQYVELLWVDRLGLYIRCEAQGREPGVVRVPFIRAVMDEREARSAITMAAQTAWELERNYVPQAPAALAGTATAN